MKLTLAFLFAASILLAQSNTYVLRAARLFDGTSDALIEPGIIVVANGTIQSVGSRSIPSGATVIDLGDATLLPGFIDAHTHLSYDFHPDYNASALLDLQRPVSEKAIRATVNARKTLMAGFTTVRDVGSTDFLDVGLRNAINEGLVPGPRMLVAVHALGSTGGHCDGGDSFSYGTLNHESRPEDGVINSPDEARYAVRFNIKYGADVIKTCASGGVLSPTDDVDAPQLTQAELDALVGEAHALRRKTAAHAHGAEAAKRAIRAGIDSIEHGTFLDDEAMRMMHDKGVFLVPTLATRVGLRESKFPPLVEAKAQRAMKQQDAMVKRALELGVKIALGTDAAVYPHGDNALEFVLMAADGMTPAQSLKAGTTSAAELLGLSDKIGALKPGLAADIVAVPGNPMTDIKVVQSVLFVMKGGSVYKNERAGASK
ncbi:MAG TPA: amidohydrolase family protein [Bryobacteraceae bacterium]|jgi:imidazolonepropionase-like amidohydrolase|nr:amidohydrolase family protein [Bryobacteraceae bacterium]